jgi:hypothetical protein
MDLNIVSNALNDDCLSCIYSFVNTRKLCFDILKRKRDTILTNHILTPTIKRFTEGKYYTPSDCCFLGDMTFRVEKITKCFIIICYWHDLICFPNKVDTLKMKRRYDENDYEYIDIRSRSRSFNTKNLIELDKLSLCGITLYKEFDFYWKRGTFYRRQEAEAVLYQLVNSKKEVGGEIGWALVEPRNKQIEEYERESMEPQCEMSRQCYVRWAQKLMDLNKQQLWAQKLMDLNKQQLWAQKLMDLNKQQLLLG